MAHFRGTLRGARGMTSRLGTKSSGVTSHLRSWNNDLYVTLRNDMEKEADLIRVELHNKDAKVFADITPGQMIELLRMHNHRRTTDADYAKL